MTQLPNPIGGYATAPVNRMAAATAGPKATSSEMGDPLAALKLKKAWEAAMAPAKALPMNAFMLWMAGGGVQIFSIMITGMMLYNPFKAMLSLGTGGIATIGSSNKVQATSSSPLDHARAFLGSPLVKAKLVFILFQCCAVAMGVWKLQGMGLLPTAHSDWLAWVPAKVYRETALL